MPTHGSQEDVPASGSSNRVSARFQQGFTRFLQSSIKVPARFHRGKVPEGASKVPAKLHQVPARFQWKVPVRFRSMVPARFQRKGPASGFSGCAFSCHHSPTPEIGTEQIRCWEQVVSPASKHAKQICLMKLCFYMQSIMTMFGTTL